MGCDLYRAGRFNGKCTDFNPRTRMGCDFGVVDRCIFRFISIHAPAWGATHQSSTALILILFQSTHPHGVRHCFTSILTRTLGNFNPRTRMGCDDTLWGICNRFYKFQSTHPHGVRLRAASRIAELTSISIHAPAWGATRFNDITYFCEKFQSTHPHGVRPVAHT